MLDLLVLPLVAIEDQAMLVTQVTEMHLIVKSAHLVYLIYIPKSYIMTPRNHGAGFDLSLYENTLLYYNINHLNPL